MADYHIYIHSKTAQSSSSSNTKTFSNGGEDESFASMMQPAKQAYSAVASGNVVNTGVAALSKAVPWVAIAVAIMKTADKIISTGFAHQEEYTGDYKHNVNYNNFKTVAGNVMNPIKWANGLVHRQFQYQKREIAREQEKQLLGNSILQDIGV